MVLGGGSADGLAGSLAGTSAAFGSAAAASWPGNSTAQHFVIAQWQRQALEFDLVVVNLAPHRSQCYAPLNRDNLATHNWAMTDLLGPERFKRSGDDLKNQGLYLDLPAHGAQLFHFEPIN